MFTNVLNAPVSELAVSHDVNVVKDFFDTRSLYHIRTLALSQTEDFPFRLPYLVFFETILKDILHN